MFRSSAAAAIAGRVMRQIGASSRPLILHGRPIAAVPINNVRPLLFSDSMLRSPAVYQSRGYARGRPAISSEDDDDDNDDDDDEDGEEIDEFDDDEGLDGEDSDEDDGEDGSK